MTTDAKGVLCVAATGSKKIDTVAAELVPLNAGPPACLILGAGSSASSGIPPWKAFDGEVLGLLE
jgi:hypothetical protein